MLHLFIVHSVALLILYVKSTVQTYLVIFFKPTKTFPVQSGLYLKVLILCSQSFHMFTDVKIRSCLYTNCCLLSASDHFVTMISCCSNKSSCVSCTDSTVRTWNLYNFLAREKVKKYTKNTFENIYFDKPTNSYKVCFRQAIPAIFLKTP